MRAFFAATATTARLQGHSGTLKPQDHHLVQMTGRTETNEGFDSARMGILSALAIVHFTNPLTNLLHEAKGCGSQAVFHDEAPLESLAAYRHNRHACRCSGNSFAAQHVVGRGSNLMPRRISRFFGL